MAEKLFSFFYHIVLRISALITSIFNLSISKLPSDYGLRGVTGVSDDSTALV